MWCNSYIIVFTKNIISVYNVFIKKIKSPLAPQRAIKANMHLRSLINERKSIEVQILSAIKLNGRHLPAAISARLAVQSCGWILKAKS